MFVEESELIEFSIFYKKLGRHHFNVLEKVAYKELDEEERVGYVELNVKTKPLTWGKYNDIQESSISIDSNSGLRKFNHKVFKEFKLVSVLAGWDAKVKKEDGSLVPVPLTKENILKMAPEIAEAILNMYDSLETLSDEDSKK